MYVGKLTRVVRKRKLMKGTRKADLGVHGLCGAHFPVEKELLFLVVYRLYRSWREDGIQRTEETLSE